MNISGDETKTSTEGPITVTEIFLYNVTELEDGYYYSYTGEPLQIIISDQNEDNKSFTLPTVSRTGYEANSSWKDSEGNPVSEITADGKTYNCYPDSDKWVKVPITITTSQPQW